MLAIGSYQAPTLYTSSPQVQMVAPVSSGRTTEAKTYYISPTGNDENAGTSPTSAWKSLSKINSLDLNPGDQVLLQRGYGYSGNLSFTQEDAGTPTAPITISSYGTGGTATINAGTGNAMFIYDVAGYNISNLKIVGSGISTNTGEGIVAYNDLANNVKLDGITIKNVDVSGFRGYGIAIGGWNQQSGFRNVKVTDVLTHDNGEGGLITYAQIPNVHENVYVGYVSTYNNGGTNFPSDVDGIVLGGVKGGIIERSIAYNNVGKGGVGIWTYDSTSITIQHNESYNNRTTSSHDGGGFDLDNNVSDSIMQYNYSHDNHGAGFLLCHGLNNLNYTGNIVRYNISQNDGRNNGYGGIDIYGKVTNSQIYNNTVFLNSAATGNPSAIRIWNLGFEGLDPSGLYFRNNIFQTQDGLNLVDADKNALDTAKDIVFQGNNYYSSGSPFNILWNGITYNSLDSWRTATGEEKLDENNVGFSVDPLFNNPKGGTTVNNPDLLNKLAAYRLDSTSPLIDQGLNLMSLFNINPGTQDFNGTSLPQGLGYDIGAVESLQK